MANRFWLRKLCGSGGSSPPTPATGYHPTLLDEPVVSGTAQVGETLTITGDTWANDVGTVDFTYQWYRGLDPIVGATSATYVPTTADEFFYLRCTKTGTNDTGEWTAYTPFTELVQPASLSDFNFGWGAKTRSGHGGRPVGVGRSITSGNTGSDFTIDDLGELVASGTYGNQKTYSASTYNLTLDNGDTVFIKIIANRFDVVARLGSASNNDVYTGGGTSFQLRNILSLSSGGEVIRGDEIYDVGTRFINPDTVDCRLATLSGGYAGTGMVRIYNLHIVQLAFHAATDFEIPLEFVKPVGYNNNAASGSTLILGPANTSNGYGWSVYDGTFECGPAFTAPQNMIFVKIRGPGNAERNSFKNGGYGVNTAIAAGMDNGNIRDNTAQHMHQDSIQGRWQGAGCVVSNNYSYDVKFASGAHADNVQHLGFSDGLNHEIGEVSFIFGARNDTEAGRQSFQGILLTGNTSSATVTATVHHCGFLTDFTNGIFVNNQVDLSLKFCLALHDVGNDSGAAVNPCNMYDDDPDTSSGGEISNNISNNNVNGAFAADATYGPHTQLATTQPALDGCFADHQRTGLTSRAAWIAAHTPLEGGTAKNVDGTYNGPLLPNGCWNMGEVFT